MSDADFLALRTASLAGVKPEAKADEPAATPPKEEAKADATSAPEAKPEERKAEDVPSHKQVDLSELSDDEIRELAEKGKSGLLKRIAELTAKRKLAEEKAAQLEAQLRQKPEPKLETKPTELPETIAKVNSVEELQKLHQTATDYVEWAEEVLFNNDHLGADEVVTEVDGKQFTKKQVKEYLSLARKNRDKYLPARLQQIQDAERRKAEKAAYNAQMRKEIPWLNGEDNDLRRQFETLAKAPLVEKMRKAVPEAEPVLDYMVAHAVNSVYGRREVKDPAFQQPAPRINPPTTSPSSSAPPERPEQVVSKKVKEVAERFKTTGSANDFVALRAAQISNRKRIA